MDRNEHRPAGFLNEDPICRDDPEEEDPFGYNSVPLEIVGTIKVRYVFVGELKPMPYDWDD